MAAKNGQAAKVTLASLLPIPGSKIKVQYHFVDEEFQEKWARVFQMLAAAIDDDGTPREGASVILFAESGRLKACLVDKHTGQRSFFVLDPNQSVWDQLEAALERGAEWHSKKEKPAGTPVF